MMKLKVAAGLSAKKHRRKFKAIRYLAGSLSLFLGLTLVTSGAMAKLNANAFNLTATQIKTGSVRLTQSASGLSAGWTTPISGIVPGDSQIRYLSFTQSTQAATSPTITITDSAASLLSTSSTRGLQLTIDRCTVAWTFTVGSAIAGTCSGTSYSVLASTAISTLSTAKTLTNFNTTASGVNYLKVTISLPIGTTETIIDGAMSTAGATTIFGLSANLTLIISETQRAAVLRNA